MKYLRPFCLALLLCLGFLLCLGLRGANAQSDRPILFLDPAGHTSVVHQVLFTPSGKELISVGEDKVIRVWDTGTGKQLGTIHGQIGEGPHDKLYAAALSRDGKTLAVAGNTYEGDLSDNFDKNRVYIRLLHLDDLRSQPMRVSMTLLPADTGIKAHMNTIYTLAFSPADPTLLASGSQDNNVCLWNTQTGKSVRVLEGHTDGVDGIAWSPEGSRLASASLDGSVRVWDTNSGFVAKEIKFDHPVRSVAWSPDGKMIAGGDTSGQITVYRTDGFRRASSWKQPQSVSSLVFSPDSQSLVSGQEGIGPQYPVNVWTVPTGRMDSAFPRHTANVTSVAFSGDGQLIASAGGSDNEIFLWQRPGSGPATRLAGSGGATSTVQWSQGQRPNGGTAYRLSWKTVGEKGPHLFDFSQAMTVDKVVNPAWQGAVTHLPNGHTLTQSALAVSVSGGPSVSFPPKPDASDITAQNDFVLCETFTPDGSGVVVGSRYTLALYDAASGALLRKFIGHTGPVTSVSVSPDGKYLASSSSDQTVAVWPLGGSSPEVPSPLVQLFAGADGEYVAWNPEFGYYTCSPQGERLIGWQTNNGQERLADYAPASSFVNRNRLDVMALMLDKGNAEDAIAAAGASQQKIQQTAPLIQLVSLSGEVVAGNQASFRVMLTPRAGNALSSMTLSVNGHARASRQFTGDSVDTRNFQKSGASWVGNLTVKLRPGANTVTALAFGADKTESLPSGVTVTCPAAVGSALPALNLLAIGVAKYDRFLDLTYPDADAQSITQAFASQQGKLFSRVDVTTLTNEKATRANILAALAALKDKGQKQDENDYTVVFVAGHGGDVDAQKYYLIPYDVDTSTSDDVKRTAVDWSAFNDALLSLPGNVIFMLDACHSAGKGGSNNAAYAAILSQLAHRVENGSSPIITFASCKASETSQESPLWKHGAFTRALLDGLAGAADKDHDGKVEAKELEYYVYSRVGELTAGQQTPEALGFNDNQQADLPLAIIGGKTASASEKEREARR